jgi:RNA polymerase sporulation-specific sigma factor
MLEFSQTLELIERAQANDESAKQTLINENSPLIKSVIKRYINKGLEYDDLYQLGSLGFLKAVKNFDKNFNVKFSTYAVPMIAGEIKRFLRDNGMIKVSRGVKALSIQINKFIETYFAKNLKQPSIGEIASEFNVTEQETVFALESNTAPISLYTVVGDDEGNKQQTLIEKIPNDKPIENELDNFYLLKIIKNLPPRDKKIIILRYFRDKTQREIGNILGVSQVQVSRLENKILEEIKHKISEEIN